MLLIRWYRSLEIIQTFSSNYLQPRHREIKGNLLNQRPILPTKHPERSNLTTLCCGIISR